MRGTRDWKAIVDLAEDVDTRLSDDQKMKARRTVAQITSRLGEDAKAALEVCLMLGIVGPDEDETFREVPALSVIHR